MNGFTLWVGLGAGLGLWRMARSAPQQQSRVWANVGLLVLLVGLIGARASYVWINWAYFANQPAEAFQIWSGGLTWPGAVTGAVLAYLFLAFLNRPPRHRAGARDRRPSLRRIPFGWLADRLYPLLPPLAVTVWLANWQAGIAYGAPLPDGTWWGVPSLDDSGVYRLHVPLQLLSALTLLLYFWLLEVRVKPLRPPGLLSGLGILGLLLNLIVVSLLRADPSPHWNGLRVDAWIALLCSALFLACTGIYNLLLRAGRKQHFANPERFSP